MTKKNTKRALFASVISMLLCVTMLIGSTFAWFTDTDTTAVSNIVSGTLDIEIVDADGNPKENALAFVNKNGSTGILWEPGATFQTEQFAIKNSGSLWLKFKVEINNTEVSYHKLNEAVDFYLVDAVTGNKVNLATMQDIPVGPGLNTAYYRIEGHMDENAGNEYQDLTLSGVGITVYATQYTKEVDMTDDKYDKDALYDDDIAAVSTADEFIKAFNELEEGGIITLTADINMTGKTWRPVNNKSFTLDGNNKTITGLSNGLVGHTGSSSITVKDVTFDKMTATDTYENDTYSYAGLIGDADTCSYILMENVTISNSTINSTKDENGYAAGFVAYTTGYGNDYNGPVYASHNFINCSLVNTTVTGTSSAGGVVGHCGGNTATSTTMTGIKVSGSTIEGEKSSKTGIIIGTSHIGVVNLTYTLSDVQDGNVVGRFVPVNTGKLTINGVEQIAFAN